jgi:hypothetical protein
MKNSGRDTVDKRLRPTPIAEQIATETIKPIVSCVAR